MEFKLVICSRKLTDDSSIDIAIPITFQIHFPRKEFWKSDQSFEKNNLEEFISELNTYNEILKG